VKEVKAWFILRELCLLLVFLGVLYAISFANRDVENAHRIVNYLRREFLKSDYQYHYQFGHKRQSYKFENIKSVDVYWEWLEDVFVYKYLGTRWTDKGKSRATILQYNRTNKIIGWPVLRQLRVKDGKY
jgi:hypothetical protein